MVGYRRHRVPGGSYFFTVTLLDRQSRLLTQHIDLLRRAFRHVRRERFFELNAIVILPDHLHAIWTLPVNDDDYPGRWRAIKSRFTRSIVTQGVPIAKNHKGEYDLWQRRYWEHTIRDQGDLAAHVNYIHFNPVKHGITRKVADWPYSSFHHYVCLGRLQQDWGGGAAVPEGIHFGE